MSVLSHGGSMRPTLPEHAILLVKPYEGKSIRRVDVVVLRLPGFPETVVHRVVSASGKTLVTKGDANGAPDPWEPAPEAVKGRVCYVCTPEGMRRVHGGLLGVLTASAVRVRRLTARVLVPVLRPLLAAMARQRLVSRLWALLWKPKVVCFNQRGEASLLLVARGRTIGRFDPELGEWRLIHRLRALIDVNVLPRPKPPVT